MTSIKTSAGEQSSLLAGDETSIEGMGGSMSNTRGLTPVSASSDNRSLGILSIFSVISAISVIGSLAVGVSQLLTVMVSKVGWLQYLLRVYMEIFCVIFVMTELELPKIFKRHFHFLDNWVIRGVVYSFVGVVAMEEALSVQIVGKFDQHKKFRSSLSGKASSLMIKGSASVMIIMGLVYVIMGVFCLRGVRDRLKRRSSPVVSEQ